MKKNKTLLFFLATFFIAAVYPLCSIAQVAGSWSGTASLVETTIWMGGFNRVKTVNVSFTDNMGSGSVIDNGKSNLGDTKCEGSGKAILQHVSISLGHNTYTIHIQSPPCNGSSSTYTPGKRAPYGPEITDLVISDQPLRDPNALAGTQTTVTDLGGGYNTTTIITWSLKRTSDLELIVTPEDYDTWLPEPGANELMKGKKVMKISLKVLGRNGQPPTLKARSFELRLSNTSKEPGITLNAPLVPSPDQLPDIRFIQNILAESNKEDQFIKIPCRDGTTGEVFLGSYDGGGWTTLTAEAILEDGTRIPGHLLVTSGETEIPVPKRNTGSSIASSWLAANGNPGENDDIETSAGNTNNGDGLTAYEEYRGFIILEEQNGNITGTKFHRLDPNEKELGIQVRKSEFSLFSEGFSWFENASGLKLIYFSENEIGQDRRLNKNFSSVHIYDQYVLKLVKGIINEKNVVGKTYPVPGIPKNVEVIKIDYVKMAQQQQEKELAARKEKMQLPFTLKDLLAKNIGHELAHGVNVSHHGESEINTIDKMIEKDSRIHIFLPYSSSEITDRPFPVFGNLDESGSGNQGSGDVFCIMNYAPGYNWAYREGNNSFTYYGVPLLRVGNIMCNSKAGTAYNEKDSGGHNNYFGDAITGGNCLSQIKLKD